MKTLCSIILLAVATLSTAAAQPTITGVNAFWYLGPGINADNGYFAQAAWTANPNGSSGTPTWTVVTNSGGGSVSLSCYTCANTVATSTAPSNGCTYDITVYVTYPDTTQSSNFYVAIVVPNTTTLYSVVNSPYPGRTDGYLSTTTWNLTDSCSYSDPGLDLNETFGTWTNDVSNDWNLPLFLSPGSFTFTGTSLVNDNMAVAGEDMPPSLVPQSPLLNDPVVHDYPWTYYAGSLTNGSGTVVRQDTQQFYTDHGGHD
jgi:hypothetical protein